MVSLAVHGGAGEIREPAKKRRGLERAISAGKSILETGGDAVAAVVAAVMILEDDEHFNAGYGSVLNADGQVECDAGLKEGRLLDIGAVAAVRTLRNPIQGALALLREPTILLAKDDAEAFAAARGVARIAPRDLMSPARLEAFQAGGEASKSGDTVGAVALDEAGTLAAATSTGGIFRKPVGRIGDSPLPGCGYDAENMLGACSTTGWGESIARLSLARRALEFLARGYSLEQAAEQTITLLGNRIVGGSGGLILMDAKGAVAARWNTPAMAYASWSPGGGVFVHSG